jgi:hypothetical protein
VTGAKKHSNRKHKTARPSQRASEQGGGRAAMSWSVKRLADQRATKVAASQVCESPPGFLQFQSQQRGAEKAYLGWQAPQKNGGEGARVGQSALAVISKPNQRILVIGDGNFSFAASLVSLFNGDGSSITATVYDSREVLKSKYADADQHVASLQVCTFITYAPAARVILLVTSSSPR